MRELGGQGLQENAFHGVILRQPVDKPHGIDNVDNMDCATSLTGVAIAAAESRR